MRVAGDATNKQHGRRDVKVEPTDTHIPRLKGQSHGVPICRMRDKTKTGHSHNVVGSHILRGKPEKISICRLPALIRCDLLQTASLGSALAKTTELIFPLVILWAQLQFRSCELLLWPPLHMDEGILLPDHFGSLLFDFRATSDPVGFWPVSRHDFTATFALSFGCLSR